MSVFIIVLLILNVFPLPVVVRLYSLLSMRKAECEPSSLPVTLDGLFKYIRYKWT